MQYSKIMLYLNRKCDREFKNRELLPYYIIIFELKPETPNSMKAGIKQLVRYEQGARENKDLKKITEWVKILVTYKIK